MICTLRFFNRLRTSFPKMCYRHQWHQHMFVEMFCLDQLQFFHNKLPGGHLLLFSPFTLP